MSRVPSQQRRLSTLRLQLSNSAKRYCAPSCLGSSGALTPFPFISPALCAPKRRYQLRPLPEENHYGSQIEAKLGSRDGGITVLLRNDTGDKTAAHPALYADSAS